MAESSDKTENWNMAIQTLKRLSFLLDSCSVFAVREDFLNWFKVLFDLRRHLSPFMEKDELNKIKDKFNTLPKGWKIGGKVHPEHSPKVHKFLDEMQIEMLMIMKREGLLMPKSDDPRFALTQ